MRSILPLFFFALIAVPSAHSQDRAPDQASQNHAAQLPAEPAPDDEAENQRSSQLTQPPVERFTLENGLEVFLHPDPRSSQAAVCTVYDVGARDDPEGYRGIAHLMEHMAFRGSENAPQGYLRLLDTIGASNYNGSTHNDRTQYHAVVPSRQLQTALWIEADRMAYLLTGATEEQLEDEQAIVLHEWRQRGGAGSGATMRRALWDEFYPEGHPYRDAFDHPDDIRAVDLSDIRWHFQHYYQPNNARIAVVGRFDRASARAHIEELFGPIRPQGPRASRRSSEPVRLDGETVVHMEGSVGRSRVIITWPTPSFLAPGDAELDVVAALLDGHVDRILEAALVQTRIANRVSASQASSELGSHFTIDVSGNIDHPASEILSIIDRELSKLREELVAASDVEAAVAKWQMRYLGAEDMMGWRACSLAAHHPPGGGVFDLAFNRRRYAEINPEQVRATARRYLSPERRVVILMENDRDAGDLEVERIERRPAGGQ
ncbi:MAG: hypothetical protein DRJ42_24130 [Deltaproteobacteria bacterium]|nr:MAG: hypothetical protein DRJ42_24130 [Deltaproteobacteria bacterium]